MQISLSKLDGSLVTREWRVFGTQNEGWSPRTEGSCKYIEVHTRRGGPPVWGLGSGLQTYIVKV
jgi:hypothetical protein